MKPARAIALIHKVRLGLVPEDGTATAALAEDI
jgi:hypothetical protein